MYGEAVEAAEGKGRECSFLRSHFLGARDPVVRIALLRVGEFHPARADQAVQVVFQFCLLRGNRRSSGKWRLGPKIATSSAPRVRARSGDRSPLTFALGQAAILYSAQACFLIASVVLRNCLVVVEQTCFRVGGAHAPGVSFGSRKRAVEVYLWATNMAREGRTKAKKEGEIFFFSFFFFFLGLVEKRPRILQRAIFSL